MVDGPLNIIPSRWSALFHPIPTAASCFAVNRHSSHRHRHNGIKMRLAPQEDALMPSSMLPPPQFCYTLSLIQWSNHSGNLSKCTLGVVGLRGWTWWFVSLPILQFNVLRSRKSYLLGDPKKMHQNLKYSCLSNTMQGFAQWTIILSDHSSAHTNFILHAYFIAWCMGGAPSSLDGQNSSDVSANSFHLHLHCYSISLAWLPFPTHV